MRGIQVQLDEGLASGDDKGDDASVSTNEVEADKQNSIEEGPSNYDKLTPTKLKGKNYYKMKKVENTLDSLPHVIIELGFM